MDTQLEILLIIITLLTSISTATAPATIDVVADPSLSATALGTILTHLGFHSLAMAVPTLPVTSSTINIWSGPLTVFALSDASIYSCSSCSLPEILQEHIVPGMFSLHYLQSLALGTKIETIVPGRCVTVTNSDNRTKIFVEGVEISRPEIFNNGLLLVHGIDGHVAHLSPFSCNVERMTSHAFYPKVVDDRSISSYSMLLKTAGGLSGAGAWNIYILLLLVVFVGIILVGIAINSMGESRNLQCETCGYLSASESELVSHFREFHNEFKHKCPDCIHKFISQRKLTEHRLKNHAYCIPTSPIYRCTNPSHPTFKTESALRAHVKRTHPRT